MARYADRARRGMGHGTAASDGALARTLLTSGWWVDGHAETRDSLQLLDGVGHRPGGNGAGRLDSELLGWPAGSGPHR